EGDVVEGTDVGADGDFALARAGKPGTVAGAFAAGAVVATGTLGTGAAFAGGGVAGAAGGLAETATIAPGVGAGAIAAGTIAVATGAVVAGGRAGGFILGPLRAEAEVLELGKIQLVEFLGRLVVGGSLGHNDSGR